MNAQLNTDQDYYTVRLNEAEAITVSKEEIASLNESREAQGLDSLLKIKRSSGETEFVSETALKMLQRNRARRRNQRLLAELQQSTEQKSKFQQLLSRIFVR